MAIQTEGKSLVDLLDMLEPAPVPTPVSMMPQTWGWVVLAVVLAGCLGAVVFALLRHRHLNAYRRAALAELSTPDLSAAKAAETLRRAALVAYPRRKVAGLYGEDWTAFIQQTSDSKSFSKATFHQLIEAPYRDTAPSPDLIALAKHWVKTHKPERRPR